MDNATPEIIQVKKNNKKLIIRGLLWCAMIALLAFSYRQLYFSYLVMEQSSRLSEMLLHKQTLLMQLKSEQVMLLKNDLKNTEVLVQQLQIENDQLRGQEKTIDKIVELEGEIIQLEEKNAQLEEQVASLKKQTPDFNETVKNLQDGRKWLAEYSRWINKVKGRMQAIKKEQYVKDVAQQTEQDRVESLLGNNGYLVRNGQLLPRDIPPAPTREVKVDVQFVK